MKQDSRERQDKPAPETGSVGMLDHGSTTITPKPTPTAPEPK
jgi:hypothetical protein